MNGILPFTVSMTVLYASTMIHMAAQPWRGIFATAAAMSKRYGRNDKTKSHKCSDNVFQSSLLHE